MNARLLAVMVALGLSLSLSGDAEAGKRPVSTAKVTGVVNLNQATAKELDMLPGVGPKAAQAILAFREQHKFSRIEELVKVKGFGKKRFSKLRAYLSVTGDTTIQVEKPEKPGKEGAKEEHVSAEVR